MDKSKVNYGPASVYEKRGHFRIIFYWRPDFNQPLRRYRKSFNLNRIKDLKARRESAYIMASSVTEMLKAGWNPETDNIPTAINDKAQGKVKLLDAIDTALKSKLLKVPKKTSRGAYKSNTSLFKEYLIKQKLAQLFASEFNDLHAQDYQDHLIKTGLSFVTINTKMEYISALFKHMRKKKLIKENPFADLDKLKERKSTYYVLFTMKELQTIKESLTVNFPELWQFFLFIFYCFMRPLSICAIQKKHIDFEAKTIFLGADDNKNGTNTYKQLLNEHIKYLRPFVAKLKSDDYLFSTWDLKPGKKAVVRNRVSEAWNLWVIQKLGIDKKMYSGKHSGAAYFLMANKGKENLLWLQRQLDHSDLQTTSIYTNKLLVAMLDEDKENVVEI